MRETITPDMINAVQKALKNGEYDFETLKINIFGGDVAPCSVTQSLFPAIIDLALEHLKRKASYNLVEWVSDEIEPKTNNIEVEIKDHKVVKKLKNKLLPQFDWNLTNTNNL